VKFNKGDIVRVRKDSRYYGRVAPPDIPGEVVGISLSDPIVYVKWPPQRQRVGDFMPSFYEVTEMDIELNEEVLYEV